MSSANLENGDAAVVLDVVESLTTARTLDEYSRIAMVGIRELIPCIDASYNEMNPGASV